MEEIKGELLMIWDRQDPHVPQEGRALIYEAMTKAGLRFTWHEFNAAHAFLRDEGPRYDPELALRCYSMTADSFRRKLGQGAEAAARSDPLAGRPARAAHAA